MSVYEVLEVGQVENKGKYQQITLKVSKDGKQSEKKLMSFGDGATAFKFFQSNGPGTYEVKQKQNDKGFWTWFEVFPMTGNTAPKAGASPAPRNTYETPEERAIRQKLIVRQSSITNAIALFELDKKRVPTVVDIIAVARQFEDYVFGKAQTPEQELIEMEDDIPL